MRLLKIFSKKKTFNYQVYFDVFEKIYTLTPSAFFWITPFPNKSGRYILSHFKEAFFTKYNGLEIVIFDNKQMTYHRLPGAKPDGHGHVEIGEHYICVNSMHDLEKTYFKIEKINPLDFVFHRIEAIPEINSHYHHLECRTLPYDLFIPELIENILSGLEWCYRSHKLTHIALDASWHDIFNLIKNSDMNWRIKMLVERITTGAENEIDTSSLT